MNRNNQTKLLYEILNYSHDMIFIISIDDGNIEYVNQTAIDNCGYSFEEMNKLGIENFRKPIKKQESFSQHLQELKVKNSLVDYAYLVRKDGTEFPVEVNAKFVQIEGVNYNIAIARDITKRLEAEHQLESLNKDLTSLVAEKTDELQKNIAFLGSYKRAMDESSIVSKSDLKGIITYVNDKFCEVSGFTKEEVIGKPHSIIKHPDTECEVFTKLWNDITTKKTWKGILKNKKKDGGYYWVDSSVVPILDDKGEIYEYMATRHDITELIEQRETLEKIANTDSLTDLGNRYKLFHDMELLNNPSIAIIDIERFSEINDLYGDAFGDSVIQEVGNTIKDLIQDKSTKSLYRLQADIFAILNLSVEKSEFIKKIDEIIKKIENITYQVDNEEVAIQVTASISFEAENLLVTAEMAMKNAKKKKTNLLVYSDEFNLDLVYENNIKWTNKLRSAIKNDMLIPYYQPIVNNKTGEWEKYESLVRMIDEDGKVITPYFFLEIAKLTKYYETLTKTVIKKSFDTFKNSAKEFSINLTIKDIMNLDMQAYIYKTLQEYNIGKQVVFEIVESEGIEEYETVIEFINNVKKQGCKIAIDDFGTGYSNFNYLLKLQADYIKLDASLIKNIETDVNARILVKTIVGFAKELDILTIAEYVENNRVYEIVKEIGIDYSQGYFFSEPREFPQF